MINAILGTKLGQKQTFTEDGTRIPTTFVQAGPCWVTHIAHFGGFTNIELAYDSLRRQTRAMAGHIKKAGLTIRPRFLRSIRIGSQGDFGELSLGKQITVGDVFQPGDIVRVTGTSKGKGFAGVVKRHHFAGGPKTHGQSDRERAPGSIGQSTTPGRVYRGKRMAGRMGSDSVTVRNLRVVAIDLEKNLLTISGVVPGGRRGLLLIQKET